MIGEVPRVEATLGFKTDPRWGTESSGLVRPKAVGAALMAMGGYFPAATLASERRILALIRSYFSRCSSLSER